MHVNNEEINNAVNKQQFLETELVRVKKNLYTSERRTFGSKVDFINWYKDKIIDQDYCCHYCGTSIFLIRKLIEAGLLKTRKVRGEGVRGPVLEIDKNDESYVPDRCVLSCYYCNNDKSYTTSGEDYKLYFGSARYKYFNDLLKKLN